jgi:glycosyltransferase involved in cell wall biosynthesis
MVRETLGFDEDDFVVLTVADNQERKNLSRGMEILAELKKKHGVKAKHILVTRESSPVGWKLYDLAMELGLSSDLRVFNSGLPFRDLYMLYACSDAFLLCSKGEGLGLPVMEAMAVGLPVVANGVGAIPELLENGRGYTIEPDYMMIDPFGNQHRHFMPIAASVNALKYIHENRGLREVTDAARKYVEGRSWGVAANEIEASIVKVVGEQ